MKITSKPYAASRSFIMLKRVLTLALGCILGMKLYSGLLMS